MGKILAGWRRAERELECELGHPPEPGRIARRLGLTAKQLELVEDALRSRRLGPGIEEEGREVEDYSSPGESLERSEEVAGLRARMASRLDARERELITLRFGLDDGEPRTLREVGQQLGITREWARKLELRAIGKLRGNSD